MNSTFLSSQIRPPFKRQNTAQTEKPRRIMNSREGTRNNRKGKGDTMAVAATTGWPLQPPRAGRCSHNGLWCTLWAGRGAFWLAWLLRSNAVFCAFSWFASFALDLPSWAYWASFATPLDLVLPQFYAFLLILGSTCVNLQSKPEQAKTKRNRRNMRINRKIMQINPKIESNSIKKIHIHI